MVIKALTNIYQSIINTLTHLIIWDIVHQSNIMYNNIICGPEGTTRL